MIRYFVFGRTNQAILIGWNLSGTIIPKAASRPRVPLYVFAYTVDLAAHSLTLSDFLVTLITCSVEECNGLRCSEVGLAMVSIPLVSTQVASLVDPAGRILDSSSCATWHQQSMRLGSDDFCVRKPFRRSSIRDQNVLKVEAPLRGSADQKLSRRSEKARNSRAVPQKLESKSKSSFSIFQLYDVSATFGRDRTRIIRNKRSITSKSVVTWSRVSRQSDR